MSTAISPLIHLFRAVSYSGMDRRKVPTVLVVYELVECIQSTERLFGINGNS